METESGTGPFRYKAFFSYSRADDWVANRLHAYLQRFVTPGDIIGFHGRYGQVPKSLRPVFRDRVNLVGGGTLDDRLREAIEQSECLIVLCSPAAAKSSFVNQEVEIFRALGRADRIIPVIAAGEPNSGDPETECFPPALRDLDILAPDLRHIRAKGGRVIGDGELVGRLKLIAGLLGLDDLDALYRSEQRRQRRLTAIVAAVAVAFLVFGIAAAAGGWLALVNGQKAHDNLERFFAVNGHKALADGKPLLAMRYALAGHALSDKNGDDYRDLLADAYQSLGENEVHQNAGGAESEVAFAHGDRDVVIGGHDGVIHVWTPASRADAAINFAEQIDAVAVTPEGNTVAVGGDQGGIGILDLATKKWLLPKTGHGDFIMSMAISGDGQWMAASSHDETIRIWDARTGQPRGAIRDFAEHSGFPKALAFVPGSRMLAAGGADGVIYTIDAATGRPGRSFAINQDTARAVEINADAIAFSPDGKWLAAALDDGTVQVWRAASGKRAGPAFGSGHANYNAIAFAPDSWTVATAGEDHAVRLWDMSTGQQVAALNGHEDQVFSLAFAKDGRLVSSTYDGSVRLWAAPVAADPIVAVDAGDLAQGLAVSREAGTVMITQASGLFRLQDVRSGTPIVAARTRDAKRAVLDAPVVTVPGGKVFVRAAGKFLYFVDARTGAQIGDPLAVGGDDISALAVSADGRFLASASDDFAIRVWDTKTRKQVGRQYHRQP